MTSTREQRWSVLLLHDQLQDAEVLGRLARVVGDYAVVHTLHTEPFRNFGAPAWSDHIGARARKAIANGSVPRTVHLVVAVGQAGEAAVALVADEHADAALLINPDFTVLNETVPNKDVPAAERFTDSGERLRNYLLGIGMYAGNPASELPPEDGVAALVRASLENMVGLDPDDRDMVRRVANQQVLAALPLTEEQLRLEPKHDTTWIEQAARIAERCTVAMSACGPWQDKLRRALRHTAPGVDVIMLHSTSWHVWLTAPETVGTVVHDLLPG